MLFSLAVTSQGSSLAQRNILTQERTLVQESTQGIVFDTLVHDFGIMEKGSDAECSFTFTNGKEEPLLITQVKAPAVVPCHTGPGNRLHRVIQV